MAKKKTSILPAGKRLYEAHCSGDIDARRFAGIAPLKAHIVKTGACKDLDVKQLQMVALYLWDGKNAPAPIPVTKDEKCPVCGMFVAKYPQWVARITTKEGASLAFDGAKDFFKFVFEPAKWTKGATTFDKLLVTDYYSLGGIDARSALFVIGSDVLGPMGHELIPFASRKDAERFLADHHGEKILAFGEVTKEIVYGLDKRK